LRGVYSECLVIPTFFISQHSEGKDLMEKLGIYKYEPPARPVQLSSGRKIKYKDNPNFGIYYKFPNIKNVTGMFTDEDRVQITRKIHGTNARYGIVKKRNLSLWDKVKKFVRLADEWIEYEYVYGSHNVEKGSDSQGFYDTDVWRTIADKYDIKDKLWTYVKLHGPSVIGSGVVLYGEIYGPGIQKNYDYGLKDIEFIGFDFVENGEYQNTFRTKHVIANVFNLPHVEELYIGPWLQELQTKFLYDGIPGTKVPHEGVVIKDVSGNRHKVAKVINPDYLIYGEKYDVGDSH
jgi:hypothetical protein